MFELWFLFAVLVMFSLYVYIQWKLKHEERLLNDYEPITEIFLLGTFGFVTPRRGVNISIMSQTTQPDESNIYNISSRVQGSTHQYPDAYVSVDHIAITNELNKPPKYDDAPPSYEEAIKLATAHSNSIQTFQAEEATRQNQPHTSTATTSVVPAIHSRTTE